MSLQFHLDKLKDIDNNDKFEVTKETLTHHAPNAASTITILQTSFVIISIL